MISDSAWAPSLSFCSGTWKTLLLMVKVDEKRKRKGAFYYYTVRPFFIIESLTRKSVYIQTNNK